MEDYRLFDNPIIIIQLSIIFIRIIYFINPFLGGIGYEQIINFFSKAVKIVIARYIV